MIKTNKSWFTLVELVVVIVIIWILASIWIASYKLLIWWANDTKRVSDLHEIEKVIITINEKWLKPKTLWMVADQFKEYPVDPINWFWYQYNVNIDTASSRYKKLSWKWYILCTNAPLEKYIDTNWDVKSDYLSDYEVDTYNDFVWWKVRNIVSGKPEAITPNLTIWHYCLWETDDFNALIAWWWGSNSLWTENCSESILNPDLDWEELWKPCKIVFNAEKTAQASSTNPAPGTPMPMPSE
jgi:Tfp pilus assembly protein PilE